MSPTPVAPWRVAIIGGGISGLSAAYRLAQARRSGLPLEEHLFEAGPRLGGVLRTEQVDGCVIECGADSFLTEKRDAIDLCRELGLAGELLGSNDERRRTLILHRGRLEPLPDGFEFLVPTRLLSVARTRLLSLRDKLALAAEIFQRPPAYARDESVASFVQRHFSPGLVDTIVDPLLTAVYGGDAHLLSAPAVLPRFVELEKQYGSLVRGVRRAARERRKNAGARGGKGSRPPLFTTLRGGLETLVTALEAQLEKQRVHCGYRVAAIEPAAVAGRALHHIQVEDEAPVEAEGVILALPAHESARLLHPLDALLGEQLAGIPYSSSLIAAAVYEASVARQVPPGFGFLVPRKERPRLLACTFVGTKFPHRVPAERVLLRCFYGGMGDEGVLELSDAEVEAMLQADLKQVLGLTARPLFVKVYRWPKAMAQYTLGHLERLKIIQARLEQHPGLFLCGNAYEGIGVPDCIRSGQAAAQACLRLLETQGESRAGTV